MLSFNSHLNINVFDNTSWLMNFPGMSARMQTNERYVWYVSPPYLISSPSKSREKCITYAEAASACFENITLNRNQR